MENLDDISLAFMTRRDRATIVLKRQMETIGRVRLYIALINMYTTNNQEITRLSHELNENMLDIAEIMDGFKDDVTRMLQHTVDESEELLTKYKEWEAARQK